MRHALIRLSLMPSRRFTIVVVLFVVTLASGYAQSPLDDPGENRTVLVLIAPLGDTVDDVVTPRILRTSIEQMLVQKGLTAVAGDLSPTIDPGRVPSERRTTAILGSVDSTDAGLIIGAFFLNTDGQFFVQFVLYDPTVNAPLGGVLARARQGLTVFAGVEAAVADLEPVVDRYLAGEYFAEEPEGLVESVLVRGATESADVFFIDRRVGTISGGTLLVPFVQYEIGTSLQVHAEKPGYHRIEGVFSLPARESVIELPAMVRQTQYDLGIRSSIGMGFGVGVAARLHIVPDTLFVSVEHQRLFRPAGSPDARDVQVFDYSFAAGRYIVFDYRSRVRLHVGTGFGVTVSDVVGLEGRDYNDWYVMVGEPTVELNLGRSSFFLRPDLRYTLGIGYNTLGRIWMRTPYGIIPFSAGARFSW
ncbi:MAG: hypothetical protein ACLFNQ_12305 [Spirochaetaceae bacterium]